jgi:hypothetical protein
MIDSRKILKRALVLDLLAESDLSFMYVTSPDACQKCLQYDKRIMSDEDAEGTFQYLVKGPNDGVWYPNVHPSCRCLLILLGGRL